MTTKTARAKGLTDSEASYVDAIQECLREMAAVRRQMKKTDAEIRRLRSASRRKLDETWTIIGRVQATH